MEVKNPAGSLPRSGWPPAPTAFGHQNLRRSSNPADSSVCWRTTCPQDVHFEGFELWTRPQDSHFQLAIPGDYSPQPHQPRRRYTPLTQK
jgi:hypothetical protein